MAAPVHLQDELSPARLGFGLRGQVALVTGASQGIGAAVALALAEAGADIVLNHLDGDDESVLRISEAIQGLGRRCLPIQADVASQPAVNDMMAEATRTFGRIDIAVNNAGISPEAALADTTEALWDRVHAVNLKAQFLVCQAVAPAMAAAGYGRIINIASEQGLIGASRMAAYCASKAGVFGLTKALARELAPLGILVNCVAPGPVDTTMLAQIDRTPEMASRIPLGRIGTPAEIAFAVLFLASPQSSWTTGQIISPNGGVVMA